MLITTTTIYYIDDLEYYNMYTPFCKMYTCVCAWLPIDYVHFRSPIRHA